MAIASLVCVGLLIVSLPHFLWGVGRKWPVRDEAQLAQLVVGRPGVGHMPPWYRSLAIAVLTLAAAVFALALADHDAGSAIMTAVGALVALVFLARGVTGYLPAWKLRTPEQPFRTFDAKYYSPLCLIIGSGFAALVALRLM